MTFTIKKKWTVTVIIALLIISCSDTENRPIRILTGGIRHESNTFSTDLTMEGDFTVLRGEEVLENSEWAEHFSGTQTRFIPTLHAYARPYGVVSREAFEKFMGEITEGVRQSGEIDGIYLDMHGALHAEGYEDAQEYLIKEIRKVAGENVLISGSFDLHGNMSAGFVNELDILTAFRTAPHVDGNETKIRAIQLLTGAIKNSMKPAIVHIPVPVLIPGEKGITFVEPLYSIYERLPEISEKEGILDASVFIGCAWSDLKRTSITVQVVAEDSSYMAMAENEARKLAADIWNIRSELEFEVPVAEIDDAIDVALDDPAQTVYISDSGDNTTAGAAGDIPLVLERLIAKGVKDAVVAGIVDRKAVLECIENGTGS
ncbi:MAG: M81 family metallopeptidase, partial [bacterium]